MRYISAASKWINIIAVAEAMALAVLYTRCYHSANIRISGRTELTLIFIAGVLVFGILFLLQRFPRFFPFPVKIRPANMAYQAEIAKLFLTVMSVLVTGVFICALYGRYRSLLYDPQEAAYLPMYVPLGLCGLCIASTILYIISARKHR